MGIKNVEPNTFIFCDYDPDILKSVIICKNDINKKFRKLNMKSKILKQKSKIFNKIDSNNCNIYLKD